jgi:hypothetical protein
MNLDLYTDNEIEVLKEQIRFLEIEISLIASEKGDVERLIHQYEIRYNKELGDLIKKNLEARKERLKKEAETNPDKNYEYKEAEKEYHEFNETFEEINKLNQFDLSDDEISDMKIKFKKACKYCHPDKVAEEFKEEAQKVFIELKNAYDSNNIKRVSEILELLEKGIFKTGSESITEKEKLLKYYNTLKVRLNILKKELKELRKTEIYIIISTIKDYDSHFESLRQQLTTKLSEY